MKNKEELARGGREGICNRKCDMWKGLVEEWLGTEKLEKEVGAKLERALWIKEFEIHPEARENHGGILFWPDQTEDSEGLCVCDIIQCTGGQALKWYQTTTGKGPRQGGEQTYQERGMFQR